MQFWCPNYYRSSSKFAGNWWRNFLKSRQNIWEIGNVFEKLKSNFYRIVPSIECATRNFYTISRIVLQKETIQNVPASGNHNFIRARDRNPGCKTGSSIPVSETKIRGSCETAGEVESTRTTVSRRQAWSDIVNPLANISIRLRIRSATTEMQQESAPRALYRAILICIS